MITFCLNRTQFKREMDFFKYAAFTDVWDLYPCWNDINKNITLYPIYSRIVILFREY